MPERTCRRLFLRHGCGLPKHEGGQQHAKQNEPAPKTNCLKKRPRHGKLLVTWQEHSLANITRVKSSMYVPAHFAENDLATLHAAIERYSFATLVSTLDGNLEASHLPLLLNREGGPNGTLLGHMARANLQWRRAADQ